MDPTLILYRLDPARNMARFYTLSLETTLFGDVSLTRRWGRIGTLGREIVELHRDHATAQAALDRLISMKRRRGYRG